MATSEQSTFVAPLYIVDEFEELQDLRYSDLLNLEEYRTLKMKKNDGIAVDEARLTELESVYINKIVTSARWNKFQNALVSMQNFIKNEVQDYVVTKQNEFQAEIDKFSDKGTYSPDILYYKNNFVAYNDGSGIKTYLAIANPPLGTIPTNLTYWRILTITGTKGEDGIGIGLTFRGEWNSGIIYAKDQGVQFGGALFASLIDNNISHTPDLTQDTAYWAKAIEIAVTSTPLQGIRTIATVTSNVNFITGEITSFNPSVDELEVRANTTVLIKGLQYSINVNNQSIDNLQGNWDGTIEPIVFEFIVRKYRINNLIFSDGSALSDGTVSKAKLTTDVQTTLDNVAVNSNQIAVLNADYIRHPGFATTTGIANTYAITLSPAPTSYVDGMGVTVKINIDSTGASTLNVNALGAIPLKSATGTDITNLKLNGVYTFRYNSTTGNFIQQGEGVDVLPLITSVNNILDS